MQTQTPFTKVEFTGHAEDTQDVFSTFQTNPDVQVQILFCKTDPLGHPPHVSVVELVLRTRFPSQIQFVLSEFDEEFKGQGLQAKFILAVPKIQIHYSFFHSWFKPHLSTHNGPTRRNPYLHSHEPESISNTSFIPPHTTTFVHTPFEFLEKP